MEDIAGFSTEFLSLGVNNVDQYQGGSGKYLGTQELWSMFRSELESNREVCLVANTR